MIDLRSLAAALGGEVSGRDTVLAPGPGHSPRDRSMSVRLDAAAPDGFVVHSHATDDWKSCRDYVRRKLNLPDWEPGDERKRTIPSRKVAEWDLANIEAEAAENTPPRSEDDLLRIRRATSIWQEAGPASGTLAERYLASRALALTKALDGAVLRFHPACPWRNENTGKTDRLPALIAAFRSIDDDEITAIHRIALTKDGRKIDRRMLGIVQRAAVKLGGFGDTLSIGEGVETCMAGEQLNFAPAWALGSVGAITFFPVLPGIKCLRIFGEAGQASKDATTTCGRRWKAAGRRVQIIQPSLGSDLNDELIAGRASA